MQEHCRFVDSIEEPTDAVDISQPGPSEPKPQATSLTTDDIDKNLDDLDTKNLEEFLKEFMQTEGQTDTSEAG